jgi:hypothetical protein|tara:strand:+ start:1349 stop:1744 length:396 start_codon:yes stop_codon:yes gene_type:complete
MAYKGYKGCGPKGLGASPLKQQQSIMQKEDGSAYTKKDASSEHKKRLSASVEDVPVESTRKGAAGGIGLIGGTIGKGMTAIASKLFGKSKNQKALDAFLKASPKDPTKTTRLSHYNKATPKKSEYFYNKSN